MQKIIASVTKQYNLVPANGRRRSSTGKVQAWQKVMTAYCRVDGLVICGQNACTPGSALDQTLGNEYMGEIYLYYMLPNTGFNSCSVESGTP